MLETIREFAAERMAEMGEGDDVCRRHAEHFFALAASAGLRDVDSEGEERIDLVVPEHDNMRAALTWASETDPRAPLCVSPPSSSSSGLSATPMRACAGYARSSIGMQAPHPSCVPTPTERLAAPRIRLVRTPSQSKPTATV